MSHAYRAVFAGAPVQNERMLVLHTPLGPDVPVAERAGIDEAIGPVNTHIQLKSLIAQPVLLELLAAKSRTAPRANGQSSASTPSSSPTRNEVEGP